MRARRRAYLCRRCPDGRPARTRASQSSVCACYATTVKLPGACGPGGGGPRRSFVRPPNSCACGSRASWLSFDDWADRYASLNSSTGTQKFSKGLREYIRSQQCHPAITNAIPPSRPPCISASLVEKCCKTTSKSYERPRSSTLLRVRSAPQLGLRVASKCIFLRSYPQPVDKFVDNHVNYLQRWVLCLRAIAL